MSAEPSSRLFPRQSMFESRGKAFNYRILYGRYAANIYNYHYIPLPPFITVIIIIFILFISY